MLSRKQILVYLCKKRIDGFDSKSILAALAGKQGCSLKELVSTFFNVADLGYARRCRKESILWRRRYRHGDDCNEDISVNDFAAVCILMQKKMRAMMNTGLICRDKGVFRLTEKGCHWHKVATDFHVKS